MRPVLLCLAALCLLWSWSSAGPNAGGTIFVHDASWPYTDDGISYCGVGTPPPDCVDADTVLYTSGGGSAIFKVYAAFPTGGSPRLKGLSFGVRYDQPIVITAYGPCIGDLNNGAAEFPGAGWPASNTGTAIIWQFTQTTRLVEAYWFAGYDYYGTPACFQLRDNPDPNLGGMFGDDSVPPLLDPIWKYGCLGFNTTCSCGRRCPMGGDLPIGACCIGETCLILFEAECLAEGGVYQGNDLPCDPNPCAVPVEQSTWGRIKAGYR